MLYQTSSTTATTTLPATALSITTTLLTLTTSALPTTTTTTLPPPFPSNSTTPNPPPNDPPTTGECRLLGPFSLLIQTILGALALLALVFKRWRERPQRPVKVWAFDVSKQVFGSTMLHAANLLASLFSAGRERPIEDVPGREANPCSYYLLNLGIDTTIGIWFLFLTLRLLNFLAFYTPLANPPESIISGYYGHPPSAAWWFKQSMIYFIGLVIMKACVVTLIHLCPFIVDVGDWALRWTEGNTAVQIFFVMLLFPLCMNAMQYYVIDAFIKERNVGVVEVDVDDSGAEPLIVDGVGVGDDGHDTDAYGPSPAPTGSSRRRSYSRNPLLADVDDQDPAISPVVPPVGRSQRSESILLLDEDGLRRPRVSVSLSAASAGDRRGSGPLQRHGQGGESSSQPR